MDLSNDCIAAIKKYLKSEDINRKAFAEILSNHGIDSPSSIKEPLLDILLEEAKLILLDRKISLAELLRFKNYKRLFYIQEKDFLLFKNRQTIAIIEKQLEWMLEDHRIEEDEELFIVELRALFDLSYDEFEEIQTKGNLEH